MLLASASASRNGFCGRELVSMVLRMRSVIHSTIIFWCFRWFLGKHVCVRINSNVNCSEQLVLNNCSEQLATFGGYKTTPLVTNLVN